MIYEVISRKGRQFFDSIEKFQNNYKFSDVYFNPAARSELQGQPIIFGLYGPMYNGEQNGVSIIRYETKDVYENMSI